MYANENRGGTGTSGAVTRVHRIGNVLPMSSEIEDLTHAGGVVVRSDRGDTQVLLAGARRPPHDWVLPKGHIESGETPAHAARREVQEEAGIDADGERYGGEYGFTAPDGKAVRVAWFLMRFVRTVPPQENREIR